MILRPVFPEPGDPIETTDAGARQALTALYPPLAPRSVRLNLIASVDGSASGSDGTSETLSNRADRAILGTIRSLSDVVLVGAATLRAEGYLLPRTAGLAVLTARGDFTGAQVADDPQRNRVIVLGPATAEARARATLDVAFDFVTVGSDAVGSEPAVEVAAVIEALWDRGLERVVCEGGPGLAAQLLAAGRIDELCLSTSPKLVGGGHPVLGAGDRVEQQLTLRSLLVDETGGVYARWRFAG